jgi:hypothetical protein
MACAIMGGWMRSQYVVDSFTITYSKWTHFLFSDNFGVWWETDLVRHVDDNWQFFGRLSDWHFQSLPIPSTDSELPDFEFAANADIVRTFCGFYFAAQISKEKPPEILKSTWIVPYWSIVIPLTAISSWLLLSKPRPAKPPAIAKAG